MSIERRRSISAAGLMVAIALCAFPAHVSNAETNDVLKNFGVGIGALCGGPGGGPIGEAVIGADKKIHVTKQENTEARLILEYHFWLATEEENTMIVQLARVLHIPGSEKTKHEDGVVAGGLQVVVLTDSANAKIDGFGGGYICGVRSSDEKRSFNIGIGAVLQNEYRQFASGFADGQPLPEGETEIRYKDTSAVRYYVVASFSW